MFDQKIIDKAVKTFKKGGIVVFPTDTVWGIGVSLNCPEAIQKLYQIKKRKKEKPTAVLIGTLGQAEQLGKLNKAAKNLIEKYWPGGLTLVVKAQKTVPKIIQGKRDTVGLRMPREESLLKILEILGTGIVAASANFFEQTPPTRKDMLDSRLLDMADLVLSGEAGGQSASTVLDLTTKPFKILRKGRVKPALVKEAQN